MTLSIIFMFVSAFICLVLPLLTAVIMMVKRKGNWTMFLLGIVSFTVSQLLIRLPLLNELQNAAWFNMFIITQPFLYAMLLALSAGVFEETGRFAAMRFLNKGLLTWENGILFGLGHAGIEAFWIVGIPYVKSVISIISENGAYALAGYSPFVFLAAGVERLLTNIIHIAFTVLVLYAVKRRRIWYFVLAILTHGLVDAALPILNKLGVIMDTWTAEGVIAVFAAIAVIAIILTKPSLKATGEGSNKQ